MKSYLPLIPAVIITAFIALILTNEYTPVLSHPAPEKSSNFKLSPKERLGKLIFEDANLSTPAGQACVDCHTREAGFGEPDNSLPVSRGVYPERFGNRNDLPSAYASFSPKFHYDDEDSVYVGGQFWDGRAADLAEQAKGPFLNPLEMANPDKKSVIDKIRTSHYAGLFMEIYGADAFGDVEKAYDLTADAITEYEKSKEMNRFSSRYDLFLAGKISLTEEEQRGLALFEDKDKGNCMACHPSSPGPDGEPPLFTDFTYDNLGTPKNAENPFYYLPPSLNPQGTGYVDMGLGAILNKKEENGKFKVPSLRNCEITGPYMHNGVFKTLRQVISFYNTRDIGPWPEPEVAENINREELGDLKLSEQEIDDIAAFLLTLTDN